LTLINNKSGERKMTMKSIVKNNTDEVQSYIWVPKHGITLQPGDSIAIPGIVQAKLPRYRKLMQADLEAGRVVIVTTDSTEELIEQKKASTEKQAEPKKEVPVKKAPVVLEGDSLADMNIEIPAVEDDDTSMPGVTVVDEDDKDIILNERGEELPPDPEPVIVNNIYDIDEDDILAQPTQEEVAEIQEDLEAMNVKELKKMASDAGIDFKKNASKKKVIELIEEAQK